MSTISIIMPVRNAAVYLPECIESIIAQSHSDWELIAVDDHSADGSYAILKNYAGSEKRIRVIKNQGRGITPALISGYNLARGSYVSRMDADDKMPIDKLLTLKNALDLDGQGHVATGLVLYFADYPLGDGFKNYELWLNSLTRRNNNLTEIYKECPIASPNWLMYRTDFDKCGAFHSDSYPEDYDLVFRMRAAGMQVTGVPQLTHKWRDSKNRASRTDDNYADNRFSTMKVKYFLQQDYSAEETLVLWGAGPKGKALAKELTNNDINFSWISNNTKKIGHNIYGTVVAPISNLRQLGNCQIIIAVSQQGAKAEILATLNENNIANYYFFC